MSAPAFPFSAVVGHEDAKLALLLNAVDRRVGGVLLRGQKGSAKSTLARGLAGLLGKETPFVELPVSATEDRVVGTLDVASALIAGQRRFHPGLLAAADAGVLYVDEVNLLPDHLVDVLLDVAASGVNRVEREGISESHPSRFVLIGSMNPEEGDLRPQLLDRFGLAVDVVSSTDPSERAEAVARRLAFDADPEAFLAGWSAEEDAAAGRLVAAAGSAARLPAGMLATVASLCARVGAEGLRADLVICRAAAALASWDGRDEATVEDVRRVAPMALAHRRRRSPLEDPGIGEDEIEVALEGDGGGGDGPARPDEGEPGDGEAGEGGRGGARSRPPAPVPSPSRVVRITGPGGAEAGRRGVAEGSERGRVVGARRPDGPVAGVAVGATLRAAAGRVASGGAAGVVADDLREAVREQKTSSLVVIAVDASASMGVEQRMTAVKGAVVSLLLDAYQRRDRVALVSFAGERADVVLRPTGSVEVARARLAELATGGRTPLADGIDAALGVALESAPGRRPLLVLVSDGRATHAAGGADPVAAARDAAARVAGHGVAAVVVDVEDGPTRLGLAAELAAVMGARHVALGELTAGALAAGIRDAAGLS